MPQQQQKSTLAARLGNRLSGANAATKDKPPIETQMRLPPGIRNGVAKVSAVYFKEQTEENKKIPKGENFFRASAIVVWPEYVNGVKAKGAVTQQVIALCDVPAKGEFGKAESFDANYDEFRSLMYHLGIKAPPFDENSDPDGTKVQAYWEAAFAALTNPQKPTYIVFNTRGYTPPKTPTRPNPEEMVFEDWVGLATQEQVQQAFGGSSKPDPAAGVREVNPAAVQPPPNSAPPSPNGAAHAPAPARDPAADYADTVAVLVEMAMNDPEGATAEGADASLKLEQMAWALGWSKDQTKNATDWAQVGDMALNAPTAAPQPQTTGVGRDTTPTVGSKWLFCKRDKNGAKLCNNKGEEFPPQEVEVVSVDAASRTCTLKTTRDGKDVVDIRTKKPVDVKWEWLEAQTPPY